MAKVTTAKQNFTAGELSPRLTGRTDLVVMIMAHNLLKIF